MNLMINIVSAILLTTLSGSILYIIWYIFGIILERTGFVNLMYELLKVVMLFYIFPISYFILLICNDMIWGGFLFRYNTKLGDICSTIFVAWIIGFLFLFIRFMMKAIRIRFLSKKAVFAGEDIYSLFVEVCEELGIEKRQVELVNDSHQDIPCIVGLWKGYVILPVKEYTLEELRLIFLHELIHFKQKNHVLRYCNEIVLAIHFFNPVVWIFQRKVQYWGEYACDFEVITRAGNAKNYFAMMLKMIIPQASADGLQSFLFRSRSQLERRMKLVKMRCKVKKSKLIAGIVSSVMFTLSAVSVSLSTVLAGEYYYDSFFGTSDSVSENKIEIESLEYTAEGFEPGVILKRDGNSIISAYGLTGFDWYIRDNSTQSSSDSSVTVGQCINVTANVSPSSAQFRMGIIEPDGSLRYVVGSGSASHNFSTSVSGKYAVYIQNMSDGEIEVGVYYNVD